MSSADTGHPPSLLRGAAVAAAIVGATGSIYLLSRAGSHQPSIILWILFIGWILLPWIALLFAWRSNRRWLMQVRKVLYWLMIGMASVSLPGYAGVFSPPNTKLAFVFLVGPLLSWAVIGIFVVIVWIRSRAGNPALHDDQPTK